MKPAMGGAALAALLALSSVSMAQTPPTVIDHVVGYTTVDGNPAMVEVLVIRPQNADPKVAADRALGAVGARREPPDDDFWFLGFAWPQFFDRVRRNNLVTMNYNPAGDPTGGAGLTAVLHAEQTWSRVAGSSFRFHDGGLTDRTPSLAVGGECPGAAARHLDGFNDIGWCPISWAAAYAATIFDPYTAEAIESDIVITTEPHEMYTGRKLTWSDVTGGDQLDVESMVLHELGHTVGLDHSDDPDSVMYWAMMLFPDYFYTHRTLTATETDAVRALYPIHPAVLRSHGADGYEVIAEIGTPAPGGGVHQGYFEPGGVNARGEVAFVTDVPEGQALFVSGPKGVRQIARSGQVIAGITLGVGSVEQVAINDSGDVVFAWFVGPPEDPYSATALFLADGRGSIAVMVAPGADAPAGGTFFEEFSPSISNRGDIAFNAYVAVGSAWIRGVYRIGKRGIVDVVAQVGDPAPDGGLFTWTGQASISNSGDVAFAAETTVSSSAGVYLRDGRTGTLKAIARPGDVAPGGGHFEYAAQPRVNSHGDVLFGGWEVGQQAGYSLYEARSRGAIERVVAPGDLMPDGWRLWGAISSWLVSWTINDGGDVAFLCWLESDPEWDPFLGEYWTGYTQAVFASRHGVLREVARLNDVIMGVGQIRSFTSNLAVLLDDGGSVFFPLRTMADRRVLLRTGPKF
jgi:hypothetical protein